MTCDMCGKKPDLAGAMAGCWLENHWTSECRCGCGRRLYKSEPLFPMKEFEEAHEEAAKICDRVDS